MVLILFVLAGIGVYFLYQQPPPTPKAGSPVVSPPASVSQAPVTPPSPPVKREEPVAPVVAVSEKPAPVALVPEVTTRLSEERFGNGKLRAVGMLKMVAEGAWVKDGTWTNYWSNGSINTTGDYQDGEQVGAWPFWTDSGLALGTNQFRARKSSEVKLASVAPPKPEPLRSAAGTRGRLFRCAKVVVAYDLKAPDQKMGLFQPGSELELKEPAQGDKVEVVYRTEGGETIRALCFTGDVGLGGSTAPEISGFGFSSTYRSIADMLVTSSGAEAGGTRLERLASSKFVLIYFSAHWCPPCRAFTPELVTYYEQHRDKPFEIIFVSSDESAQDQQRYMTEMGMSWLAVRHDQIPFSSLRSMGGPGIPCLVLLDQDGAVLSHSYVNGQYVGPHKVLHDLDEKIQ